MKGGYPLKFRQILNRENAMLSVCKNIQYLVRKTTPLAHLMDTRLGCAAEALDVMLVGSSMSSTNDIENEPVNSADRLRWFSTYDLGFMNFGLDILG